jgi:hypothetical protein
MIDQIVLFKTFGRGRLLKVIKTPLPLWFCLFNPWACVAKVLAHGAVGDVEVAKRYGRWLFFFHPYRYIKDEIIKYLGVTQPVLSQWVIQQGVSEHLERAYRLVTDKSALHRTQNEAAPLNSDMAALMRNRAAAVSRERVESIRYFFESLPGLGIQWEKDSPFGLTFDVMSSHAVQSRTDAKVSVLVTAYNCEKYIRHAIESLLTQTHQNIEILIANDASTDNTADCLQDLLQRDARLKLWNLPENVGTYAAKSILLDFAQGEYVVCHDSDDLASPFFIEKTLAALTDDQSKVAAISDWFRVDEQLHLYPGAVRRFFPILSMNHSSLMLRTSLLKRLGGWDVPRVAADTELFERIKLMYGADSICHLNAPLTIGSYRQDSLMNSQQVGAVNNEAFLRRIRYREAWLDWHDQCKKRGIEPIMHSAFDETRPFPVPAELRVDPLAIQRCHQAIAQQADH